MECECTARAAHCPAVTEEFVGYAWPDCFVCGRLAHCRRFAAFASFCPRSNRKHNRSQFPHSTMSKESVVMTDPSADFDALRWELQLRNTLCCKISLPRSFSHAV